MKTNPQNIENQTSYTRTTLFNDAFMPDWE